MEKFKYLILLSALSLLLSACIKTHVEPNLLPPETQTGKNTFGCRVNGKAWLPIVPFPANCLTGGLYQGYVYIYVKRDKDKTDQYLYIGRENVTGVGTYLLNNSYKPEVHLTDFTNNCNYYTDSLNTGHLIITRLDTINGIISGRFDFKVKQNGCPDIAVTEGRFDYNYH